MSGGADADIALLNGMLEQWGRGVRVVAGDAGVYVLLIRLQARGKGSGVAIDAEVANVVTIRDGRIARLEMHWDRDAALTAAGVGRDAG